MKIGLVIWDLTVSGGTQRQVIEDRKSVTYTIRTAYSGSLNQSYRSWPTVSPWD
jgi:hypothetical protein